MKTFKTILKIKQWQTEANALSPKKGDWAPDFELPELDSKSSVRLADYRAKKPVVLVFGSHT